MLQVNFQLYKIRFFFRILNKLLIPFFVKNKKLNLLCFLFKLNLTKIKKFFLKIAPNTKLLF